MTVQDMLRAGNEFVHRIIRLTGKVFRLSSSLLYYESHPPTSPPGIGRRRLQCVTALELVDRKQGMSCLAEVS